MSGDPTVLMMGDDPTPGRQQELRKTLGLDKPLYVQYGLFLSQIIKGDFGYSWRSRRPVIKVILRRFPATLELTAAGMFLSIIIGVPLGIACALYQGGIIDRFGKVFALAGQSMPTFWVGIMLILLFAVKWGVLPSSGRGDLRQLILPAFTLGWFSMAAYTRLARSSMLDVLDSEYIKLARIKGLPEYLVIFKHALKNASLSLITMFGLQFATLLTGAVLTETVFTWPGIGWTAVDAIFTRDYPIVMAVTTLAAVLFVSINLIVDILYAYINPRITYE